MSSDKQTILIVEDEPKLAKLLQDYLVQSGFETHHIDNGLAVVPWVKEHAPALLLLDLMLPDRDGLSICKEIRLFSSVPVIMVTARVEEFDRLSGLEYGADDYICKPFSPREVVARVKAVLRRSLTTELMPDPTRVFEIDEDKYKVTFHGKALKLTLVEFRLLRKLLSNSGRVFSRNQLIDQLYEDHRIVNERTVDTHIKNLRKKLESVSPEQEIIRSVYGIGYTIEM